MFLDIVSFKHYWLLWDVMANWWEAPYFIAVFFALHSIHSYVNAKVELLDDILENVENK